MKIRAHNLLCIQGFVGKGYSPEFVANMRAIVDSLEEESLVTVLDEPDDLCAACPNLAIAGCALHGDGSERGIVRQDRDVLQRLGLEANRTYRWGLVLERIRERVRPGDLASICGECPWLPLGHCADGLRRLAEAGRAGTQPRSRA